jgi:hypothetical protein
MTVEWEPLQITSLGKDEVFVFGSNGSGFHGAGAAGYAFRGCSANTWRQDGAFLRAMRSPEGHPDRVGRWAVFGVSRGHQEGREGASYAVQTVTRPGARRSIERRDIYFQLVGLWHFLRGRGATTWISPLGESLAGYTHEEMGEVWSHLLLKHGRPAAVRFIRA